MNQTTPGKMEQERIRKMLGSMDPSMLQAFAEVFGASRGQHGRQATPGTSPPSRMVMDNLAGLGGASSSSLLPLPDDIRDDLFFQHMKKAAEQGPPGVYDGTSCIPNFVEAYADHALFHAQKQQEIGMGLEQRQQEQKKKNKKSSETPMIVRESMRPHTEHGVAPDLGPNLTRSSIRQVAKMVNHIHYDKCIFVRTIYEPIRVVGVHTLVQDGAGDCIMLALYNFLLDLQNDDVRQMLPTGTYLAILAPYMKNSRDQKDLPLFLRCDNPQCIVVYESRAEWESAKNDGVVSRSSMHGDGIGADQSTATAQSLREQGNRAFQRGSYQVAVRLYNRAIKKHGSDGWSGDAPSTSGFKKNGGGGSGSGSAVKKSATAPTRKSSSPKTDAAVELLLIACYSNLAESHLRLEQWERAEECANHVLERYEPTHVKARFRRAKALWRLNRPQEARAILCQLIQEEHPTNTKKLFQNFLQDVDRACLESQGIYDYSRMRQQWKETQHDRKLFFHADYQSPHVEFGVEIAAASTGAAAFNAASGTTNPVTYRGCRAKQELREHTLISASKAFVSNRKGGGDISNDISFGVNVYTKQMEKNNDIELVNSLISLLLSRPRCAEVLYSLSAGKGFPMEIPPADKQKLDIPRIRAIRRNNSFAAEQDRDLEIMSLLQPHEEHHGSKSGDWRNDIEQDLVDEGKKMINGRASGLWIKESMFNHSCVANCEWTHIGDHIFIFTTKRISAGEELCIPYTDPSLSFKTKHERIFSCWISPAEGFDCKCELCTFLRTHPKYCAMNEEVYTSCQKVASKWKLLQQKQLKEGWSHSKTKRGRRLSLSGTAETVFPSHRRREILNAHEGLPLHLKHNTVALVLKLESRCLSEQGNYEEALKLCEEIAAIQSAVGGLSFRYVLSMFVVVAASMDCSNKTKAKNTLHDIYNCLSCTTVGPKTIKQGFFYMTMDCVIPFWKTFNGPSDVETMRAIIASVTK